MIRISLPLSNLSARRPPEAENKKKGKIKTDNNVIIEANSFTYNKITNILNAEGNVIIKDFNRDVIIYSENIIYNKTKEIIETNINSKAVYSKNKIIKADSFIYEKKKNFILAKGKVEAEDILKFLTKVIEKCGFKLLTDVSIALDIAANNFKSKLGYSLLKTIGNSSGGASHPPPSSSQEGSGKGGIPSSSSAMRF